MKNYLRLTDGANGYRRIPTDQHKGLIRHIHEMERTERGRTEQIRVVAERVFGDDGNTLIEGLRAGTPLSVIFAPLHPRASLRKVKAMLERLRQELDDDPIMDHLNSGGIVI